VRFASRSPFFRRLCRVLCLLLPAAVLPWTGASAQTPEPCSLCWRGRPSQYCKSFLITELGIGTRFKTYAGRSPYDDTDLYLIAALGFMRNLHSPNAVGGTINVDIDLGLLSITPRYRRWLSDILAADASAGIIVAELGNSFDNEGVSSPGFRADASVSLADVFSVGGGMESIPRRGPDDVAWHMESRLGSYPAAIGATGIVVMIGAFLVVLTSSGGWD